MVILSKAERLENSHFSAKVLLDAKVTFCFANYKPKSDKSTFMKLLKLLFIFGIFRLKVDRVK